MMREEEKGVILVGSETICDRWKADKVNMMSWGKRRRWRTIG